MLEACFFLRRGCVKYFQVVSVLSAVDGNQKFPRVEKHKETVTNGVNYKLDEDTRGDGVKELQ